MDASSLPSLYEKVLSSHTATDEVRRETEDKLLVYRHTLLLALPDPFAGIAGLPVSESAREQQEVQANKAGKDKERIGKQVQEMANGMTTLKLPNELAWRIALEWRDMQDESGSPHPDIPIEDCEADPLALQTTGIHTTSSGIWTYGQSELRTRQRSPGLS